MAIRAILFDLDGTLVQTRQASWELFAETNAEFGLGIDTRDQFFALFETNFFRSLANRCADPKRFADVKRHFLTLLRTRYTPPLVPGMADVVRSLAARFTLVVLSTNTTETIRRILTEANLAHCFAHVFAGDVEPDKSVSMRRFFADAGYRLGRRCSPAYDEGGPSRFEAGDEVVLVTDTVGDIKEAQSANVRAIGVAWGMHSERELRDAGAERVALWPQELCAWILPEADDACSGDACEPRSEARELVLAAAAVRRDRRLHPQAPRSAVAAATCSGSPETVSTHSPAIDGQLLATLARLRRAAPHKSAAQHNARKDRST
jgi:phosphoglycolate phosphatase